MKSGSAGDAVPQNVAMFPRRQERRQNYEEAFLPAALEIVETPPSPTGRAIGVTIIAVFCCAIGWATFGHVDILSSASGKVVPTGQVKLIQPFETGVIRAIDVRDGQRVKAGELLIELDPTMSAAEEQHIRNDLVAAELDIARLEAVLSDTLNPGTDFRPPEGAGPQLVATQLRLANNQVKEYQAKLASLDAQRAEKQADRDAVSATIDKLLASQTLIQQRVDILQYLSDKGLTSKLTYLETLQLLTENQKELTVQKNRMEEAKAGITAVIEARAREVAEFHRTALSDLAEAERKAGGLAGDLAKAERKTKLQLLAAPVDGIVQQLAVHTVGGVVTPAQQLAVVVPSGAPLEVEATVLNRDIGFVHVGQGAEIKVDTFNFTRYGILHGKVVSVSGDAISHEVPVDRQREKEKGADDASSEPQGQQLSYTARISLDQTRIKVENGFSDLSPGMAVTVEIKTGSRSVISYLLSPLLQYAKDSMHER